MSGVCRLPPEVWRMVIRYATFTGGPTAVFKDTTPSGSIPRDNSPCLRNDAPLTPVLYHRKPGRGQSALQAFTQVVTKRSIALVCRTFNHLVGEYLFEKLYISNGRAATRLAETLEHSQIYENPGRWACHITIVGVFFTFPAFSGELAKSAIRILSRTPHLRSFHLSWNSSTREFRERERSIVAAVPTGELRHLEWDCTGGGFEREQAHPFYPLLRSARKTLRVLKLTGYLPLAEIPMPVGQSELRGLEATTSNNDLEDYFPQLTHLKIRRAFRDDLLFIAQWNISAHLTCLSFGSIWAYFDHREMAFSFWDTPKPALRCLHLGEGANVSPSLARKMLGSARGLKTLEYFYLGEWDCDTWTGVQHECLEVVKVHVSHPVIALRSLFSSQRFSRDQQWEKILRHTSPFLGYDGLQSQRVERGVSESENADPDLDLGMVTEYSAMKTLVFLEYKRNSEDLQYEPGELADWLRTTIREADIETDVKLLVEVEDFIR